MFPIRLLVALTLLLGGLQGAGWCAQPKRVPAPEFFVVVHGDRVTVRIERGSLRHVLAELHRQSGVTAQFIDPADDGTVWKTFADVPLVEALYRLLEGRSFALYFDAARTIEGESGQPALVVRIMPPPAAAPVAETGVATVLDRPLLKPQPPPAAATVLGRPLLTPQPPPATATVLDRPLLKPQPPPAAAVPADNAAPPGAASPERSPQPAAIPDEPIVEPRPDSSE